MLDQLIEGEWGLHRAVTEIRSSSGSESLVRISIKDGDSCEVSDGDRVWQSSIPILTREHYYICFVEGDRSVKGQCWTQSKQACTCDTRVSLYLIFG